MVGRENTVAAKLSALPELERYSIACSHYRHQENYLWERGASGDRDPQHQHPTLDLSNTQLLRHGQGGGQADEARGDMDLDKPRVWNERGHQPPDGA